MRLTNEEKLGMVLEHLEKGITLRELSQRYRYDISNIKYFVGLYRMHGRDIFLKRGEYVVYERDFKLTAIKRKSSEDIPYRQLALELGLIDPALLRDWVDLYKTKGEAGIQTTRGRKSYLRHEDRLDKVASDEVKERLAYLEAENAYLKKLYALILTRGKRAKQK